MLSQKQKRKSACSPSRCRRTYPVPELVPEFEEQYAAFKKTLPNTVELIDGGLVTTKEQAQTAGDASARQL